MNIRNLPSQSAPEDLWQWAERRVSPPVRTLSDSSEPKSTRSPGAFRRAISNMFRLGQKVRVR